MEYSPPAFLSGRAFALVEALIVIAVLAVLGGTVITSVQGTREASADAKLERDVATLNSGLDAYLASGGSIPAGASAPVVLALLKTRADTTTAARSLGLTGSFVDPRTVILAQSPSRSNLRATWDGENLRFATTRSGGEIPGFGLDEALGAEAPVTQARERTLDVAAGGGWVWDYADVSAPSRPAALVPGTVEGSEGAGLGGDPVVQLALPLITPVGGAGASITAFPLSVGLENPNPAGSSRVYYSVNGGPSVLYAGSFTVDPDATVAAIAISLDASRFRNSGTVSATYLVEPLPLELSIAAPGSLTYAQATDPVFPPFATVSLLNEIPSRYLSSENFVIRYTTDGSDPLDSPASQTGPAFDGIYSPVALSLALAAWGTNNEIPIRAMAVSSKVAWFTSSDVVSSTVAVAKTVLDPPLVFPINQVVTFSVTVTMSNPATGPVAAGAIRYTTNNTAPSLVNGLTYNSPFTVSSFGVLEERALRAVTIPPPDLINWFDQSPETVRVYTGPAFAGSGIPSGALVGSATLNSTFNGNVTVAFPTNGVVPNITYNQNAVINGSLYVPGTPRIAQNSPYIPQWTPANDSRFANRIYGLVEGQSASPRVVDLNGPTSPTNYVITFNNNSYITGKIFRRTERYTLTPLDVATFPPKTSSASLSLSGPVSEPLSADNVANVTLNTTSVGSVQLLPGTYGNMTANNNSKFVLGNADDPETPVVYSFDSLALNSGGDVVIVGRVILNIRNSFALSNGAVLGNIDRPDWLQINVWSSSSINIASGSSIYGRIFAPDNTIAFNNGSTLDGSVSARNLQLNSSSVVFSLSPANSPGP